MSLGDDWDALGAAPAAAAPRASVADDWEATPTAKPPAAKPMGPPQTLSWFDRQLAKLPDIFTSDPGTVREAVGTTLGASAPGRAVMGAIDMGTGAVQAAAHLTGQGEGVDKRIAQTQGAYDVSRGDNGTDWWRIGGNVAAGVALPAGKLEEGANFVNRLILANKVGIPVALSQPVTDTANYWTEKAKQGLAGFIGSTVGAAATEGAARLAGAVANRATGVLRSFMPPAEDATIAGLQSASPELQAAVAQARARGAQLDETVLGRQIQADSLPVRMSLTPGQAKQDPMLISQEMNMRGKNPAMVYHLQDQNQKLIDNVNAIRANVAPAATAPDHVIAGQHLIDSIAQADAAKRTQISGLYQKLNDANGGNFPVDGAAFVDAADTALKSGMKTPFLPTQVRSIMDSFVDGKKQMTFENFENLRTILASEGRKADRASDGNASAAIATVRNALEALPISGETAAVKPLADAARQAARDRFQQIEQTPALKAVVNDDAVADDFIRKHVVGASKQGLKNLAATLGDDPVALQTMKAGVVNYLKNSAGIVNDNGNFSQAGYNKALAAVKPKLGILFNGDEAHMLGTLGDVARYTQIQPRGAFVNNSNTDVAAVARGAMAHGVDSATGTPVGSLVNRGVTSILEKKANATRLGEILNPGAGISTPGATQTFLTRTLPEGAAQYGGIPLSALFSREATRRSDKSAGNGKQ